MTLMMRTILFRLTVQVLSLIFLLLKQSSVILSVNAFSAKEQGSSVSFMSEAMSLTIRPFDFSKDMDNLNSICKNVYEGKDYLPKIAQSLAEDTKSCSFLVLQDDATKNDVDFVAVANYKRTGPSTAWLECVRTCPKYRGKGYATILIEHIIQLAKSESRTLTSCTVSSNTAMQSVFKNCGFHSISHIRNLSFAALLKLNGWGSNQSEEIDSDAQPPENLIKALGLEHLIGNEAIELAENNWKRVSDMVEVTNILQQMEELGGCGHVPSLYNLLHEKEIEEAVQNQRIYALNHVGHPPALMVFHLDDRISSLRSQWVCCVAATTVTALESALWFATTSKDVLAQLDGHTSFTLAFDSAIPIDDEESLPANLPLVEDTCIVFSLKN